MRAGCRFAVRQDSNLALVLCCTPLEPSISLFPKELRTFRTLRNVRPSPTLAIAGEKRRARYYESRDLAAKSARHARSFGLASRAAG